MAIKSSMAFMKYSLVAKIIILLCLLNGCKHSNQTIYSTDSSQLNSIAYKENEEGIEFLKEFYTKYYGEYSDRKGIENYVSVRVLSRMDSLTKADNLILDYDPFIQGQDWDANVLLKSLSIIPLKNKDEFRVSFLLFEERDTTNIDIQLNKNKKGKLLIYTILNDKYLNFLDKKENQNHLKSIQQKISKDWIGIYEGTFLRLKEESADPRGWATITLEISENHIVFDLFSYVEENKFQLDIIEQKKDTLKLKISNDSIRENSILLYKKNNEYLFESSYIHKILHNKELIKMTKK
jgi:hypothetical protein